MTIHYGDKDHACKVRNGYLWGHFKPKDQPLGWYFMGALWHFENNPDYRFAESDKLLGSIGT